MRQLLYKTGTKIGAWVLLVVLGITFLCSAGASLLMLGTEVFYDGGIHLRRTMMENYCTELANEFYYQYYCNSDDPALRAEYQRRFAQVNAGMTLVDESGAVLLQNFAVEDPMFSTTRVYDPLYSDQTYIEEVYETHDAAKRRQEELLQNEGVNATLSPNIVNVHYVTYLDETWKELTFESEEEFETWCINAEADGREFTAEAQQRAIGYRLCAFVGGNTLYRVRCEIPAQLRVTDWLYDLLSVTNWAIAYRNAIAVTAVLTLLLCLALTVILCCGAGRRPDDDEIHLRWIDRVPYEILCLVPLVLLGIAAECSDYGALVVVALAILPAIVLLLTTCTRVKAACFWRYTLVGMSLHWLAKPVRALWSGTRAIARGLPVVWKLALAWTLLSLLELIVCIGTESVYIVFLLVEKVLLTPPLLLFGIHLTRLRDAARRIVAGDLHTEIDLRTMRGDVRQHAEDLTHLTEGLQNAVADQLRSERMKTELITNVSHDIKTPLTSIVNYVDLLSKERIDAPTAQEYIAVLQRQSERLRKLTEDLVEASKASSGAMETHPELLDARLLMEQALGEYEEKLQARQLEPILNVDDAPLRICADGRLLWRVIDNLMNNIVKYALPGTRVYLTAGLRGSAVELVFRNISSAQLNLSADELMERFVRGDRSRHTEGSGLGLSIAQSLTELMGGSFALDVDGDLFKATVRFAAEESPAS